ncbi:phage tail tape measure protein, partial [Aeromonas sanarellii]|uniref:phage tail tape measure protein n=1 Tax=Aeromonas sanarellii TaxID=633415 RepID=UPI0039A0BAC0
EQQAKRMGKANWVEDVAGKTALAVQLFKTTGQGMADAFGALGANATAANISMDEQFAVLGQLQATMGGGEAGTKFKAFLAGVGSAQKA